jgi:hypothetical protein
MELTGTLWIPSISHILLLGLSQLRIDGNMLSRADPKNKER